MEDNIQITITSEDGEKHTSSFAKSTISINEKMIYQTPKVKYKIIAIVGASGSGKTTIVNKLKECTTISPHYLTFSTSRPRRDEETDADYHFYTKKEFENLINNDALTQCTSFNNWYYGLEKIELNQERVNVGVFSPIALKELKQKLGNEAELKIFYIYTSDKERLKRSLNREKNPNVNEIVRRYISDKEDIDNFCNYFYPLYSVLNNETGTEFNNCIDIIKNAIQTMAFGQL